MTSTCNSVINSWKRCNNCAVCCEMGSLDIANRTLYSCRNFLYVVKLVLIWCRLMCLLSQISQRKLVSALLKPAIIPQRRNSPSGRTLGVREKMCHVGRVPHIAWWLSSYLDFCYMCSFSLLWMLNHGSSGFSCPPHIYFQLQTYCSSHYDHYILCLSHQL